MDVMRTQRSVRTKAPDSQGSPTRGGAVVIHERVLDGATIVDLASHVAAGGGTGLDLARSVGGEAVITAIEESGLRGRGGAGFPTGTKLRTVSENRSQDASTTLVVNAAEGEPGTFKDRTLVRRNPYKVLEGALIAAEAIGAHEIIIGLKETFTTEIDRVTTAIAELQAADWLDDVSVSLTLGPSSYLYGEETALLEVIEGRQPFPRVTPPYRRGIDDAPESSRSAVAAEMAAPGTPAGRPPTLVSNVETFANLPFIVSEGAVAFRSVGTDESPGTILCTISGATTRHGVEELALGTTVREAIELVGGGFSGAGAITAFVSGVSNPILPASMLDTPLTYEAMSERGAALGTAGLIVFDESDDIVAVAHGITRFLAVESCGQCEPCKQDGLEIANSLDALRRSTVTPEVLDDIERRSVSVTNEARCYLAQQQQNVVTGLLAYFPEQLAAHVETSHPATAALTIAPIVDIRDGHVLLDPAQETKQPDWSQDPSSSGKSPAARLGDNPSP